LDSRLKGLIIAAAALALAAMALGIALLRGGI
jgi:hypothetical protein